MTTVEAQPIARIYNSEPQHPENWISVDITVADNSVDLPNLIQQMYDWLSPRRLMCCFKPSAPTRTIHFWFADDNPDDAMQFKLTFGGAA